MKNQNIGEDSDKINEFLKIYKELFNTLEYDEEVGKTAEIEDELDELSAYEIQQKNVERTQKHRTGDSKMFAMRLSHELSNLGIENHLMIAQQGNKKQWVNLYKDKEQWNVANITEHLEYKQDNPIANNERNEYYLQCPVEAFLIYNPDTYIVEDIKDDGKKLEDLLKTPYYPLRQDEQKEETALVVREKNIFKRMMNYIKYSFRKAIEGLNIEDLFKPYEPPKNIENNEELSSESERTDFVPKVKVDEEIAIKRVEEKAHESKLEDKSKE